VAQSGWLACSFLFSCYRENSNNKKIFEFSVETFQGPWLKSVFFFNSRPAGILRVSLCAAPLSKFCDQSYKFCIGVCYDPTTM
jgi:hypothetical protein